MVIKSQPEEAWTTVGYSFSLLGFLGMGIWMIEGHWRHGWEAHHSRCFSWARAFTILTSVGWGIGQPWPGDESPGMSCSMEEIVDFSAIFESNYFVEQLTIVNPCEPMYLNCSPIFCWWSPITHDTKDDGHLRNRREIRSKPCPLWSGNFIATVAPMVTGADVEFQWRLGSPWDILIYCIYTIYIYIKYVQRERYIYI